MKPFEQKAFRFFLSQIKPFKATFVGIFLTIAISSGLDKLAPYFFSCIIDVLGQNLDDKQNAVHLTGYYLALYAGILIVYNIVRRFSMYLCQNIEAGLTVQTQRDALVYMSQHSTQFFNNQHSGSLGVKVNRLAQEMGHMLMMILWDFYAPFITFFFTLALLLWVNFLLGLLFVFWAVVFAFVLWKTNQPLKKFSNYRAEKWASTSARIIDILANNSLVKSFAALDYERKKLKPYLDIEAHSIWLNFHKVENARAIQYIIVCLFQISMLMLSIFLWYFDFISTGNIVFVLMLISTVMQAFRYFVFALLDWSKCVGEMENSLKLLSIPHEIADKIDAKPLKVTKGVIEFKDVDFKYTPRKKIMEGFNLKIKSHEKVGLVGVSGSGKSTLVSLLQRLYDVDKGAVLIDGQNIKDVTQDSLHRAVAVIPQDTTLFYRTIFDNIAYGRADATQQEVLDASKKAYADEFIREMPEGYQSLVGERGVKVSGGQRQRIAVARAILKNAPILILDEATSALDSESEQYIQQSMKSLMRGKTVIAIAHRLSTLQKMDRIIVMSKGQIVEQGTPEELLKHKGTYARLWKIQTGNARGKK